MQKAVLAGLAALFLLPADSKADGLPIAPGSLERIACPVAENWLPRGSSCSLLTVPEDYDAPRRERNLLIPITQLGPTNLDHMAVVLGGGGPGGGVGMDSSGGLFFWEQFRVSVLGSDRGLLLVEQRGARSDPPLQCSEIRLEVEWVLAANMPPDEEYEVFEPAAKACLERLRESDVSLEHYTTRTSAQDFEALRLALGVRQLDLIAASYASAIAFDLMEMHPRSVRLALLDSPFIPQKPLPRETIYLDRMFKRLSDKCLSIPACSNAYGDAQRNLRIAARRMGANPIRVPISNPSGQDSTLFLLNSYRTIASVEFAFYRRDLLDSLPQYLYELAVYGKSDMAREYAGNLASFYRLEGIAEALNYSIVCREQIPHKGEAAGVGDIEWSLSRNAELAKEFCNSVWNVGETIEPVGVPSKGHPMLFLTGTLDWVTPEELVVEAISGKPGTFHASLNSTHGTLFNNTCSHLVARAFMSSSGADTYHPCIERQAPNFW